MSEIILYCAPKICSSKKAVKDTQIAKHLNELNGKNLCSDYHYDTAFCTQWTILVSEYFVSFGDDKTDESPDEECFSAEDEILNFDSSPQSDKESCSAADQPCTSANVSRSCFENAVV